MSTPVGEVRPSQLLWTYGPGALIDLPNISVLTMGLDRWDTSRCIPVDEARLLASVQEMLGPQVESLLMPPINPEENVVVPGNQLGVPVRLFPRWLRCVRCQTIAEVDSELFAIKPSQYRPEDTSYVHKNCNKGSNSKAVPVRFMQACRMGHLDDFPWRYYLHEGQGNPDCFGTLEFIERGASLQTENLWVKCRGCNTPARSLVHAFGKGGQKSLPECRGRHPHLNLFEEHCSERPRAVLLGSTNSWFSISLSVLAIPQAKNVLSQLISDGWTYFQEIESEVEVGAVIKTLKKTASLPGIDSFTPKQVWNAIENKKKGPPDEPLKESDIKRPEWNVLTDKNTPSDWPFFLVSKTTVPKEGLPIIDDVLLLDRLREVNALIGFTRVEAPEESESKDERPPMAPLSRSQPTWVPASDVHGEGIFIRFKEEVVRKWEKQAGVIKRNEILQGGHKLWRSARKLDPEKGYPGIRYAMMHTLSHLLIRELSLECGYNAASIRERIYSDPNPDAAMAGLLLYTAAADSDGTLGGLVELGKPEHLGRLIKQALRRALVCSSDPLCSEHNAVNDRSVHGACCHACGFVAETSCERGNRYLDRSLLVHTFESKDAAIFSEEVWR